MSKRNASCGLNQVNRIVRLCDFLENPEIQETVQRSVPVTQPQTPGGLGFDIPLWVGLGIVGLWAALDAYAGRASLGGSKCSKCGRRCLVSRFMSTSKLSGSSPQILEELEDLRHLYAHNFAGQADARYFSHQQRHVLATTTTVRLSCGANFDGQSAPLDIPHLRYYSDCIRDIFEMFV